VFVSCAISPITIRIRLNSCRVTSNVQDAILTQILLSRA